MFQKSGLNAIERAETFVRRGKGRGAGGISFLRV